MKKYFLGFVLSLLLMSVFALNSFAAIDSIGDINHKIDILNQIYGFNFSDFLNKSELIGERTQQFDMITFQYKNEAFVVQEQLRNIIDQIDVINNSPDLSDADKMLQISKLYSEVDTALYNVDSKTMQYLYAIRKIMPTITYQRYAKKFKSFYNNLELSNSKLLSLYNNKSYNKRV